jgi:Protein of unknown function (DUF3237)
MPRGISAMPFDPGLPPALVPMCQVRCDVGALVSLGAAPLGERRYIPLTGGSVSGPELNGRIVDGGVDWQIARADGVLEIAAHYVIATPDGAQVEVQSTGMRHGPPEVMARLARGEAVAAHEYFFRTVVRFTTGAPAWLHLNKVMALAVGQRQARQVLLDFWRVT